MILGRYRFLRRLVRNESGQALWMMPFFMLILCTMLVFVINIGLIFFSHRQLQASCDAAALAGAEGLPSSTLVATQVNGYSSAPGGANTHSTMTNVTVNFQTKCLTTLTAQGQACVPPASANAVWVTETAQVPTLLGKMIGHSSTTITVTSTASHRGGDPSPFNIAIILDSTLSMNEQDTNCGATQAVCALDGVQVLMKQLNPCTKEEGTCQIANGNDVNPVDRIALFTFPNVSVGTAAIDSSCTTQLVISQVTQTTYVDAVVGPVTLLPSPAWYGIPTALPYSFPTAGATTYNPIGATTATYQLTPFLSDYKLSAATSTLNTASQLTKASGGMTNCGGILPSNYDGNYGTYYAGAIYAAQAALTQNQPLNPGSHNVIIFLSDGDANSPQSKSYLGGFYPSMPSPATNNGIYPSYNGQCGQGVTAANLATAEGTRVYTVAYGSPTFGGCITDTNGSNVGIQPCTAMQDMATYPEYFFSDYYQSGAGANGYCVSPTQPITSLSGIFGAIALDLTTSRLIPDSTP